MGPIREPIFRRRPQRTLLPGIGIASAVLAGVLIAVTLAAGLIGFDSSAVQILPRPSTAQPVVAQAVKVRAVALRDRAGTAQPRAAAPVRRVTATRTDRKSTVIAVGKPSSPTPQPPPPPAQTPPTAAPPPPPPPTRPGAPLEPLGSAVNDTTTSLAGTLRKATHGLGDGIVPLSPELGGVLTKTGDALGGVVEGTGNLLGRTLGARAARR